MSDGPAPLLRLARAAITFADGTQVGPFDAVTSGCEHLGLIGDFSGIFRVLDGRAKLTAGTAEVMSVPLSEALGRGVVGFAPLDPPLPAKLTVLAYLEESARLLGRGRAFAEQGARDTLKRFELEHLARRAVGTLRVAEKRVLLLASAALGAPPVLCAEAPLSRLDDAAMAYVEIALERARAGRLSIVSALSLEALGRERALLERSRQLLVLAGDQIEPRTPAESDAERSSRLLLTVCGSADSFIEALEALGLRPTRLGSVDALLALSAAQSNSDFQRILVELPQPEQPEAQRALKQRIVTSALEAGAALVEMRPY
jgi:ABC-type Na+ transport system ATPase subunit NatA